MTENAPTSVDDPKADEAAGFASLLATDERVLLVRRRHWFTFIDAGRWFLLAAAVGLALAALNGSIPDDGILGPLSTVLGWGFWVFILVGVVGVGWFYLLWRVERYLVTTRRVIEAGGVINKYTRDTSLAMITDMLVNHPWIGRMLGYGEIDLLTASEAGTSKIRFLPDADAFKKALLDARHEYELEVGGGRTLQEAMATMAAPIAPAAPVAPGQGSISGEDLAASLDQLAGLRDRGLITDQEFAEKKRELLDRL